MLIETYPTELNSNSLCCKIFPSIISKFSTFKIPVIIFNNVDLPIPEGPMIPIILFLFISKEKFSKILFSLNLKD